MQKTGYDTDKITAVLVFVFSILFLWQVGRLDNPLDVIFPRVILAALLLLSVVLFVKSMMRPDPRSRKSLFGFDNRGKVLAGIAGMLLWALAVPVIGFATTSVLALTGLSITLGGKKDQTPIKILSAFSISMLIVVVIYYSFSRYLEVPLPRGMLI